MIMIEEKVMMKINDYEEEIRVKNLLIKSLNERIEIEKSDNEMMKERIIELKGLLDKKQDTEIKRDINYWKGIEKAYSDKLDEYLDKIVKLEKENSIIAYENDELKEKLGMIIF